MKRLMLSLLLCLPMFLFSQSKLEILGSLDYSYRYLIKTGITQSFDYNEKGKLNTHFGINYYQKLKPKLWLKIGVGFASLGYKTKNTNLIFPSDITGQGTIDPLLQGSDNPVSQFIYNYHFLEIPFSLHYDFYEKKFKPFVEFGFVPMYYLQSITQHKLDGEIRSKDNSRNDSVNHLHLATKIALGFSYSFNEKWDLIVQPNFRYHLTKIVDAPLKEYQWSAGIGLGTRISLK